MNTLVGAAEPPEHQPPVRPVTDQHWPQPYTGRCPHCAHQITEVIVLVDLEPIQHRLARIERALRRQGATLSDIHDEIGAGLADLTEKVAAVDADLARELSDFAAQVAPKLTDDEKAQFASLSQKLADFTTQIDTADVPPAQPAPTPAPPVGPAA